MKWNVKIYMYRMKWKVALNQRLITRFSMMNIIKCIETCANKETQNQDAENGIQRRILCFAYRKMNINNLLNTEHGCKKTNWIEKMHGMCLKWVDYPTTNCGKTTHQTKHQIILYLKQNQIKQQKLILYFNLLLISWFAWIPY